MSGSPAPSLDHSHIMGLLRNILTTLGARVTTLMLALVSSIVLARSLGPDGVGLFALVLLLPGWAKALGLFGFEQANAVYAGLEPTRRPTLVWQSAAIAGLVGGITALAGAGYFVLHAPGSEVLRQGPLWLYLLPLAILPVNLVVEYWWAILRGMNRILALSSVEVGMKATSLTLIIVLVGWLKLRVTGAVTANLVADLATVTLIAVLLRRFGVLRRPSLDVPLLKRTFRFALPAHGATVTSFANYRAGELVTAMLLPPDQLAFYVIAVGLGERLWILTGSVANALLPHLTNSPTRDPALPALVARHVMIWTAGACLFLFAGAKVIIRLLYSSTFVPAAAPLRWLLPGILVLSVGKVLLAELLAREKSRYQFLASVSAAALNLIGTLVLVPGMGISGAALASSISYSVLSLLLIWCYLRETGQPWSRLVPRPSDLMAYATVLQRADVLGLVRGAPRHVRP